MKTIKQALPSAATLDINSRLLWDRRSSATILSVSLRAIDYMLARKEIKARRLGGRVLIPTTELRRIAASDTGDSLVA